MSNPPDWLGKAIAIAQHRDKINSWPWYKRLGHYLLTSWRCPCCIEYRKKNK